MEVAMQSIIDRLPHMDDEQLLILSEALDAECDRRGDRLEEHPDSARMRVRQREKSYRANLGTKAPPVRTVGMKTSGRKHQFAA
jgi:hypothetical protein